MDDRPHRLAQSVQETMPNENSPVFDKLLEFRSTKILLQKDKSRLEFGSGRKMEDLVEHRETAGGFWSD